jgi:ferric-dicitrate binding protein FerR (iron transport regulator)
MRSPLPPLARAAAKVLDQAADQDGEPPVDRAKMLRAITVALHERRQRQRRARVLGALGAAAAVAALLGGARALYVHDAHDRVPVATTGRAPPALRAEHVRGDVFVTDSPNPRTAEPRLTEGGEAPLGQRIVAREGSATLVLHSGTRLDVESNTDLRVVEGDDIQTVYLTSGTVTAAVAKVRPGARFLVRAGDVDVEVRGTAFRVERLELKGCGLSTRVTVTEGRVSVRGPDVDRLLSATEAWTSSCAPATELAPSPPSPAPAPEPAPSVAIRHSSGPAPTHAIAAAAVPSSPPSSTPVTSSELAAQNALFRDALAKSREDPAAAVAMLDAFLGRYPNAPLEEAVLAKRMRLLASLGDPRAVGAAQDYVAHYPSGFGRHDADALLNETPKVP